MIEANYYTSYHLRGIFYTKNKKKLYYSIILPSYHNLFHLIYNENQWARGAFTALNYKLG